MPDQDHPDNQGGARDGAGRMRNADRFEAEVQSFTALAAKGLGQCFDNLCTLADGGWERVEEKFEPAGGITIKVVAKDADGKILTNSRGSPILVDGRLYPDAPDDQLVLVERKVTRMAPDFRANEYLVDRVAGRPTVRQEQTGPEPTTLSTGFEKAIEKIYGDDDSEEDSGLRTQD